MTRLFKLLIIPLLIITKDLKADSDEIDSGALRYKSMVATRTEVAPTIDGNIDDEVWDQAIVLEDFIQFEPYNLKPATVETEVRVLYDDKYLYIAFQNFDPDPTKIMSRMSRRDDFEGIERNADWVGIGIDSNNDDKTGYWFALSAAEVQIDVAVDEAGREWDKFDDSWNAVWDGKTSIHSEGWSAEIRIPFNVFQYTKDVVQTWGGTFQRGYFTNQEEIQWPGRPKGVRGYIPHFGIIEGIKNIPQPNNLELVPYLLAGQTQTGSMEQVTNIGLDSRYNINSTTTLNMTFNPDFGQVEADPSVLNLSAFETRLDEKRPFFVQGANFFKSYLNLFNSRRIGKRPGFNSPETGSIVDRPNETTILGAAKILAETQSGVRYGIINAVTNQEYGTREYEENGTTKKDQFLIEPYANYFVGRVEKPFINELSTYGFMATDLKRQNDNSPASSIAADVLLNLMDNKLSFNGQVANTINEKNGYAGRFVLSYRHPVLWDLATWGGYRDKNWDVSPMGYQEKNNNWYSGGRIALRRDHPKGIFLNQKIEARLWLSGLPNGLITRNNLEIKQTNNFMNYWNFGLEFEINPETYEDDDTYRDDRAKIIKDEAWQSFNTWFTTDRRKKYVLRPWFKINKGEIRGVGTEYGARITLKPTNNINFSINSSIEDRPGSMQWVDIVDNANGAFEDANGKYDIVYANIKREQVNTELRLNIAFTSRMTFEAFYQPFNVKMDYKDYSSLNREKSLNTNPFGYNGDEDFEIDNQRGTFVYRWEYKPGSLVYIVYNLNDNNYFSSEDQEWSQSKSNSLFLKFDYFFQP